MTKTIIKILIIALISLNISNASADYKRNINDDIKIYNIDKKIKNYIDKSKNPEITANKLKNKIEKILGTNNNEIYNIYLGKNKKYNNFREYALVKIYKFIDYGDIFRYVNNDTSFAKVLENDYIKIIVSDTGFTLNNNKLFWTRKDGEIFEYMEFFKIKPEEKTAVYLKNNFLNKNGKIGCKLIKGNNTFIKGNSYNFGLLKKYQSKEEGPGTSMCPNEFTKGYSTFGISYFQRISPTTLIYINAGQDFVGIDFGSMEVK